MSREHDPLLQSHYLRQCLAHDKRPIAVLLGAGCPMAVRVVKGLSDEPLIPDIGGLTSNSFAELRASALQKQFELAFSHFGTDGLSSPNIEQFLSHLRSLAKVAGKDSVRGLSGKEISELDKSLCESLARAVDKRLPSGPTAYHNLAAWVGAIERSWPIEIFTTNYDVLVEEALELNRVPYFDGFVGSRLTFLDLQSMEDGKLPPRWNRLWKIHGSLNWFEDEAGSIHRGQGIENRRVIYPSHLKYDESRRMPYLCMIDRLRDFFRKPAAVLVTCGFSFGDQHLNEVLIQGLQGNPTTIIFALLHGELKNYPHITSLSQNRINFNALAKDQAIIGTETGDWTKGKDPNSVSDSAAVNWITDPVKATVKNAAFVLGNFANFANFARELIGEQARSGGN